MGQFFMSSAGQKYLSLDKEAVDKLLSHGCFMYLYSIAERFSVWRCACSSYPRLERTDCTLRRKILMQTSIAGSIILNDHWIKPLFVQLLSSNPIVKHMDFHGEA